MHRSTLIPAFLIRATTLASLMIPQLGCSDVSLSSSALLDQAGGSIADQGGGDQHSKDRASAPHQTSADQSAADQSAADQRAADQNVADQSAADQNEDVGPPPSLCGNGFVEESEVCDDGNRVTEACADGEEACEVCAEDCTLQAGAVSFCGDGEVNGEEECDGGERCNERCEELTFRVERLPCAPEVEDCAVFEWATIQGGSFMMGSNDPAHPDQERPVHEVTLQAFEITRSEVTVAQYRACVEAGVCSPPRCDDSDVYEGVVICNWSQGRETHPINYVSWTRMREFGAWVGADLPSEAQWEFAARSRGQEIRYPWGNEEPDCTYADFYHNEMHCNGVGTSPVCSFPAGNTAQGLCDFAGNLLEWVLDEHSSSYEGAPVDGSARCSAADCSGADAYRLCRGGLWNVVSEPLRTTYRNGGSTWDQNYMLGARLVRPAR
ncbi:MAG: SUMF1/EgtB/PvdO family nonheme iron enzyme [Myxococcota bacterium]|nr:SUMF1/EgtB/PvdO family nonheme iron enzyme [Myxococcota bacterium]